MRKNRKKIKLKYGKERVLFSDVLPYEIPLIFSNRYFYRLVSEYRISKKIMETNNKRMTLNIKKKCDVNAKNFLYLLFGMYEYDDFNCNYMQVKSVIYPFQFNIAHKPGKNRILSVIHPINQLQIIDFYEKYKYSILYLCKKSNFSLRRPDKIAQYFYYRDNLHATLLGKKKESLECYFNQYENLKTYFSYKKYANIYKFYEDYRYQRAEKKYKHLLKFDLQSCFDSIYTHSISWATGGGRDSVKLLKNGYKGNWLGDAFDDLMQSLNERETNGIIIGPEFSRIFAEIILQNIDFQVEKELNKIKDNPLLNKTHYECYRYVDDYFLFYNDDKDKQQILDTFVKWLSEYKLKISPSKTINYDRPFITNITKAKIKINGLLRNLFDHKLWEEKIIFNEYDEDEVINNDGDLTSNNEDLNTVENEKVEKEKVENLLKSKISLFIRPTNVITELKSIVSEFDVSYNDIANYTLEIMSRNLDRLLNAFDKGYKILTIEDSSQNEKIESKRISAQKSLLLFLNGIIEIAFFVYNSNRQINTTLKLQKILNSVVIYVRNDYKEKDRIVKRFNDTYRDVVLKKIQDELGLVLKTTDKNRNTMHESIYLLVIAKDLGTKYLFHPEIIKDFIESSDLKYNMFVFQILLYYYGNHNMYKDLKTKLQEDIITSFEKVPVSERNRNTELTILTADLMTCPYIEDEFKKDILQHMGINKLEIQKSIIKFAKKQKFIFTKWTGFDLNKELQAKISQEVYS